MESEALMFYEFADNGWELTYQVILPISLVTKVNGNYNITENILNFVEAPYGKIPLSTTTNPPDSRDWSGISTSSSFQGRSFMRSGVPNTVNDTYYKNVVFDDISSEFNGINKEFQFKI